MKLPIHFVAIGTELLLGKLQDANGFWLSQFLSKRGLKLSQITILADDEKEISDFLRSQDLKSQLFIFSGGLGPTLDDKTKSVLASITQSNIKHNDLALKLATEQFQRFQKTYSTLQSDYHLIPDGWEVIANPVGQAPGLLINNENFHILALPGVPHEFGAMVETQAQRLLPTQSSQNQRLTARVFGVSEEVIFFKKAPKLWKELQGLGDVSCLPNFPYVDIGITGDNLNETVFHEVIKKNLPEEIIDFDGLSVSEFVLKIALKKRLSLSVAESCTGGLCSHLLTNISGSSELYLGSVTSYAEAAKISHLGVSPDTINEHTVYSHQVAAEMASGVSKAFNSDISVSTTGLAGPSGGSENNPVGRVYIGVSIHGEVKTFSRDFHGSREHLKSRFASFAFLCLLREIA